MKGVVGGDRGPRVDYGRVVENFVQRRNFMVLNAGTVALAAGTALWGSGWGHVARLVSVFCEFVRRVWGFEYRGAAVAGAVSFKAFVAKVKVGQIDGEAFRAVPNLLSEFLARVGGGVRGSMSGFGNVGEWVGTVGTRTRVLIAVSVYSVLLQVSRGESGSAGRTKRATQRDRAPQRHAGAGGEKQATSGEKARRAAKNAL